MIPMLMLCAQLIDQADIEAKAEPVAIVQMVEDETEDYEDFEEDPEEDFDEKIYIGIEDDTYVLVDLPCGHNKADDCVDWEIGDYYECKECGYIEVYNPWYGHDCEYDLAYDGEGEYSMICNICGDAYRYYPTEDEEELYWSQYDVIEELNNDDIEED